MYTKIHFLDIIIFNIINKYYCNLDSCFSLVSKVDRLAFSVIWELDSDGNIVDTRFHRSIIRSVAAMAYNDAQKMIDAGSVYCGISGFSI